jgi:hypothetical protein
MAKNQATIETTEEICDGVKMLIERMQNNPEDFEYGGSMTGYSNTMEDILRNPKDHQPLWFLSDAEKKALVNAYKEMHKTRFTAGVVQSILAPEPQYDINMDRPYQTAMRLDSSGNLGIGTQKPSKIITPKYMMQQAEKLLEKEFEKEYAKNSRS